MITPPPPTTARVKIAPASATIAAGETRQFTARAFDANNAEIPVAAFL